MDVYIAGALAAFTVDVLVYPLDTIKTRFQSQDYVTTYASNKQNALALRGLYQGIGSVVLATLPASGLFFSTYEQAKTVIGNALPMHESLVHSSASAVAEMASCLVLAPAEVIKQNAQMLRENGSSPSSSSSSSSSSAKGKLSGLTQNSTSLQAFRQLAGKDSSRRRLFTGYTALVARNLPFTALQFPIFEQLRSWAWRRRTLDRPRDQERGIAETGVIAGVSAGSAGAVAAFITTPSDVVKTRMMITAGKTDSAGAWSVVKTVYRERGAKGLFRGGLFRSGWTAIGSSLYLGTYDAAKVWLQGRKRGSLEDEGIL